MTAQFNFGNRTFTRNRETVLTLNEEAKKNVAASFASAGFNEHFVETQLPQVNLRINKDKKKNTTTNIMSSSSTKPAILWTF